MSFLVVGGEIHWIRSGKEVRSQLEVRLLLGRYDASGRDVQPNFGIGENSVRSRILLETADDVPDVPLSREVSVGVCFPFCKPFGSPRVSLYGLLLLRQQIESARLGIWHLKPEYSSGLDEPWKRVLTRGRGGVLRVAQSAIEPTASPNVGPAKPLGSSKVGGWSPSETL
jgi:hypothetical protein